MAPGQAVPRRRSRVAESRAEHRRHHTLRPPATRMWSRQVPRAALCSAGAVGSCGGSGAGFGPSLLLWRWRPSPRPTLAAFNLSATKVYPTKKHTNTHTHTHTHLCICVYILIYIYIYVYIYISTYLPIYLSTCIYSSAI